MGVAAWGADVYRNYTQTRHVRWFEGYRTVPELRCFFSLFLFYLLLYEPYGVFDFGLLIHTRNGWVKKEGLLVGSEHERFFFS